MDYRVIQGWLDLPVGPWPPDPHVLLGVPPGEQNLQLIEERVHQRLAKIRGYQLAFPEQATEAMNRLAQAFWQLTESAKFAQALPPSPAPPLSSQGPPPAKGEGPLLIAAPAPFQESLADLASRSQPARRGLITLPALLERIDHTRHLLWTWEQVGKFLGKPQRRLTGPAEETELVVRLSELADLMANFPPLLGQPGQAGYRVLALARLRLTAALFQSFDLPQRQALARDWETGLALLRHHHRFLLGELKKVRRLGCLGWARRLIGQTIRDYPSYCLYLLLGLSSLGVLLLYLHLFLTE